MKQLIKPAFLIATALFLAGPMTGCSSKKERAENNLAEEKKEAVEDADDNREDISEARADLAKANADSVQDAQESYAEWRVKREKQIINNDREIKEYKIKARERKSDTKTSYNENVQKLEAENARLKARLAEGEKKSKAEWNEWRREYDHDMDNLGNSLRDFSKNNSR
jgi:hypothetical protein